MGTRNKQITQSYLDQKIDELSNIIKDEQKKQFDELTKLIKGLHRELEEEKVRTDKLEDKVAILQSQVTNLKYMATNAHELAEQNAQYSRRKNVLVKNIPLSTGNEQETADDCLLKVKDVIKGLGVDVPDHMIERAHRVGKRKTTKRWGDSHSMIVRFVSWRDRTAVYRARKQNPLIGMSIDLTKQRLDLISEVNQEVENYDNADFAFGDVNCQLCIRFKDNTYRHFNSLDQAVRILNKFGGNEVVHDEAVDEDEDEGEEQES